MKTISHLPGRINSYFSFTLAIIFAQLMPICLMAAQLREITIPPAEDLKQFAGTYRLLGKQDLALEISTTGSGLTLKEMWSNREISFKQTATLNFVATEHPDFTLDFARNKGGAINHVTAFKKDIWIRVNPDHTKKLSAAEATQTYQKVFTAFQEAVNGNDTDKIQSFLKTYMAETTLEAISLDDLTTRTKELSQQTGGITLDKTKPINSETGTATFKGKNQGNIFQLSFTLNPAGKITNFGLQE